MPPFGELLDRIQHRERCEHPLPRNGIVEVELPAELHGIG
jgi:hypothetical protein